MSANRQMGAVRPGKQQAMKHCLIVDDSRVIRLVARRILEELRYSVDEAEDGMTALRACRAAGW